MLAKVTQQGQLSSVPDHLLIVILLDTRWMSESGSEWKKWLKQKLSLHGGTENQGLKIGLQEAKKKSKEIKQTVFTDLANDQEYINYSQEVFLDSQLI